VSVLSSENDTSTVAHVSFTHNGLGDQATQTFQSFVTGGSGSRRLAFWIGFERADPCGIRNQTRSPRAEHGPVGIKAAAKRQASAIVALPTRAAN
jgi:hypothetical protein